MGIQINGQTDTITAVDGSITVGTDLSVPGVLSYEDVTNIDAVGLSTFQNGLHVTGGSVGIGTDNPSQARLVAQTAGGISIAAVKDNTGASISLGGVTQPRILMEASPSASDLLIYTAGGSSYGSASWSEKLRITAGGNIGIGTLTSPGALLHLRDSNDTTQGAAQLKISKGIGGGAAPSSASRTNCYIHLGGSEWRTGGGGHYLMGFGYTNGETGTGIPAYVGFVETTSSGYTYGDLIFGTRGNTTGTNNATERLRITSGGIINSNNYSFNGQGTNTASDVYLGAFAPGSSAYAIATNGAERLRINSSGIVTKPYTPAFRVRSSTNSGAFSGGDTASWDTVGLNNGSHFLTSGTGAYERFVAPVDGLYYISCMMLSQANTRLFHEIRVNNVQVAGTRTESYTASSYQTNTTVGTLQLSASDYVTIYVGPNAGYGGAYANFNGFLIG